MDKKIVNELISGCIFGGAIGDGIGLATEFLTKNTSKHYYGYGPISFGTEHGHDFVRDGHRGRWYPNDFTDDTDQTLLILECILHNNAILHPVHFAYRLKEWTQIGYPELMKRACGVGFTVGSTLSHPDFLVTPHHASFEVWRSRGRNLAANGAVMRTAILGIPFFWDESIVAKNAINAAKVTHADPRSVLSSVIVSVIISRVFRRSINCEDVTKFSINKDILLSLFEHGSQDNSELDEEKQANQVELDKMQPKVVVPPVPSNFDRVMRNFTSVIDRVLNRDAVEREYLSSLLPTKEDSAKLAKRTKNAVPVSKDIPVSMDTFGSDPDMIQLCEDVIKDYEFLLRDCSFCSDRSTDWIEELHKYCFPEKLADLELDNKESIGYTFKCLGAGIYCFTRKIPKGMSQSTFFKEVIRELILEGGDADTNGAVAGSLLGSRLGMASLPKEWLHLRHKDYLKLQITKLEDLINSTYPK